MSLEMWKGMNYEANWSIEATDLLVFSNKLLDITFKNLNYKITVVYKFTIEYGCKYANSFPSFLRLYWSIL